MEEKSGQKKGVRRFLSNYGCLLGAAMIVLLMVAMVLFPIWMPSSWFFDDDDTTEKQELTGFGIDPSEFQGKFEDEKSYSPSISTSLWENDDTITVGGDEPLDDDGGSPSQTSTTRP